MRLIKTLTLTALAAVIIAAVSVFPHGPCFKNGLNYTFYCGNGSSNCQIVTVESGAAAKKLGLKDVCGESTVYQNFDLDGFLKQVGGKIVFVEELSDSVNYYCTANLPYSVNLYGKKINLHVSVRSDSARVASPIIFGGY